MLKLFVVLLFSLTLITEGHCFKFDVSTIKIQRSQAAITSECLAFSINTDCRFYDCLHEKFPCGVKDVPQNSSRGKCEEGKREVNRLNDRDKKWMYDIIKCIMVMMTEIYKRPVFNCQHSVQLGLDIEADCYLKNDFCKVGWSRRDALRSVFEERMKKPDKFFFLLLWQNLQRAAATCQTKDSEKLITWMKSQFPTL